MELRKVRDEEEARAAIAAVAASGLPRRRWARDHGIDPRSLNAWRLNLERRARRGAELPALRLLDVTPALVLRAAPVYAVSVGDARVEVGDDFASDTLRRILEVVRSC